MDTTIMSKLSVEFWLKHYVEILDIFCRIDRSIINRLSWVLTCTWILTFHFQKVCWNECSCAAQTQLDFGLYIMFEFQTVWQNGQSCAFQTQSDFDLYIMFQFQTVWQSRQAWSVCFRLCISHTDHILSNTKCLRKWRSARSWISLNWSVNINLSASPES